MESIRLNKQGKSRKCIWMQAGVIHSKYCKHDYDCPSCNFDITMQQVARENRKIRGQGGILTGKRGQIVSWKERLRELPHWKRPCLHHMKGRINFRACTNDYVCGDCDFNQYFHDQYTVHAVVKPVDTLNISGFRIPHGFYLHRGHAWVKLEENSEVRVGLDDFALRLFGPLDRIESPLVGKAVHQDEADILLSRGENLAKVLSPVSGVVIDINPRLRENGFLASADPYSEGWVMRVHAKELRRELRNLMMGAETKEALGKDIDKLYCVIEDVVGPLAADGGHLCDDIYGNLPQLGWDRLTRIFLHT